MGGVIPGSSSLHVKSSLGKILSPELPPTDFAISILEFVYEWVNVACIVEHCERSIGLEECYISAVHLSFTIYSLK